MMAVDVIGNLPGGIVAFEFAASSRAETERLVSDYLSDERKTIFAAISIGLDYLYMPVYSTWLAYSCCAVASSGFAPSSGHALAFLSWAAAIFDAVENIGLTALLLRKKHSHWGGITFFCVVVKFALIALALGYVGVGKIVIAVSTPTKRKEN